MLNFVLKNLQNKKFWLKLHRTMLQWTFITQSILFILYLLLHMKMKKLLVGAFLWMFAVAWVAILPNYASAESGDAGRAGGFTTNWWWWSKENLTYNAGVAGADDFTDDSLITTIRTAINWVLWMLSLVALVIALYAGFLMMTSGGDEKKYQKWVGLLKWAGIWLAIIALSWLIVSLIFWVINWAISGSGESVAEVQ